MDDPEVSVIIPSRDRTWRLERAVLSALAQEDVCFEIIVVDDGSKVPISRRLGAETTDAVTVIRLESSHGPAGARNVGIEAANGTWVAFLDDDDVWSPWKLRRQLHSLSSDGEFTFASSFVIDDKGTISIDPVTVLSRDVRRVALARNPIPGCCSNLLALTSLVRSVDGFDASIHALEDWDLVIRLSEEGRAVVTKEPLLAYSLHRGNRHTHEASVRTSYHRLAEKYADVRNELGIALDLEWWWTWRLEAAIRASDWAGIAKAYWELGRLHRDPSLLVRAAVARVSGHRLIGMVGRLRRPAQPAGGVDPPPWLDHALHSAHDQGRAPGAPNGQA
ncbi:MAG: hypothetical protein QOG15_740 [Solirubrobacteraceae bacterium]|nr:hypothetical protein [Solirubrobacteraceae bacterium]